MADEDQGTESVDTTPASIEAPLEDSESELEAARAKIEALTTHNQTLESDLSRQKAANYDLLAAVRADGEQSGGGDSGDDSGDEDDGPDLDDLFE